MEKDDYIKKLEDMVLKRDQHIEFLEKESSNKDEKLLGLRRVITKDEASKKAERLEKTLETTEEMLLSKIKGGYKTNKRILNLKGQIHHLEKLEPHWRQTFETFPQFQKTRLIKEAEELVDADERQYNKIREYLVYNVYLPRILIKHELLLDENSYRNSKLCKFCIHKKVIDKAQRCKLTNRFVVDYAVCDSFE